ncbi:MAG: histidine phosphotransferase family protein [Alphaproteobacteria bacterium]
MTITNDTKILELLASKICHDLISPVGAISNGVEILEEMGSDADSDITSLISFSAAQANAKLKTMRMAYGLGGSDPSIKFEDVHKLFGEFIEGEKRLSQDWDPYADLGIEPRNGLCKMLLCGMKFAVEGLPRGGVISVQKDEDGVVLITASGENAHFRPDFVNALNHALSINDLDPKLVHAYVTGLLAKNYGFEIHTDETQDNIISLRLNCSVVS